MVLEKIKSLVDSKLKKKPAHSTNPTNSASTSLYKDFKFPNIFKKHLGSETNPEEVLVSKKKEIFVYERNCSYLNDDILSEGTRT